MRRNDLDICADILRVARSGAKKTQIVYQANLNFKIVKKYLRRLMEGGLLEKSAEDRFYTTTLKGFQFLEQYRALVAPMKKTGSLDGASFMGERLTNGVWWTPPPPRAR